MDVLYNNALHGISWIAAFKKKLSFTKKIKMSPEQFLASRLTVDGDVPQFHLHHSHHQHCTKHYMHLLKRLFRVLL